MINNIFGKYATLEEATAALNQKFLIRQVKLNPRNAEESFNLFISTLAQAQGQPLQLVASPGVDAMGNAYFYIGLRIDRQEVDLKLTVNEAIIALVLAYMSGAEQLPAVENLAPMKVSDDNKNAWYADLEKRLNSLKAVRKERIEFTDNGSYLKVTYKLAHGKITLHQGRVENLMQLLTA